MRYIHGCKPRNPLNMIIQENHVASRAYPYYITKYYFSQTPLYDYCPTNL